MSRIFLLYAEPQTLPEPGTVTPIRLSTGGQYPPLYDGATWPARLLDVYRRDVDAFQGATGVGGPSIPGQGPIKIGLNDGERDDLVQLSWDGAPLSIYVGEEQASFSSFTRIFQGTIADLTWTRDALVLQMRDLQELLNVPVQGHIYAGTGQLEGVVELKAVAKPLCYGKPRRVPPLLIDPPFRVFQIHDGPLSAVAQGVADRGVSLAWAGDISTLGLVSVYAWTPVGGKYVTDNARGVFRLGAPPNGVITCEPVNLIETAADIIKELVTREAHLTVADLDMASFTTLNTAQSTALGVFLPDGTTTIASVLDQIMQTVGGFWTFNRLGKLVVQQIAFGTPVTTLTEKDVVAIERVRTALPVWRLRMEYGRKFRPLSAEESLTPDTVFVETVKTEEFNALNVHPLARDLTVQALFTFAAGTAPATEVIRQLGILTQVVVAAQGFRRDRYDVTVRSREFQWALGDTVRLAYPRFGLTAGRNYLVLGLSEDANKEGQTVLRLFG